MDTSDFSQQYETKSDDELLCLWADRGILVPEAELALESEVQRRGLKKENAARVKQRLDKLAAREGSLAQQVAAAKYERNMRHFIGWEEPEFDSRYSSRDIRGLFPYLRYKYRVWKSFRDHTGSWPVLSITYYFASCLAPFALIKFLFIRSVGGKAPGGLVVIGGTIAFFFVQRLGAKLMRKLDWKYRSDAITSD